ncbi:MAG: hypothetical protein RIE84_11305 [Parvibaculum sp.]|uniref:hypothetical protein n=1 Tax=Parvibaculum sp. TaxID=2024848 RepID=UPI0032EDC498
MALTKPEFLSKWTSAVGAGLLAAGLSLSPLSGAYAQSASEVAHTQDVCSRDASSESPNIQAGQHSMCTREVGIVVTGRTNQYTGEEIGQLIVQEFAKRGVPAKFFTEPMPGDEHRFAVSFALKGVVYGPFGEDWAKGFKHVQAEYPRVWAALPANERG